MSFQEKSLWLVLLSLVGVYGVYFVTALPQTTANVEPQHIGFFVAAIVVLVITQIVGHAVIAIVDRRSDTDERDRLIGLIGTRNGSYMLAVGVFASLCTAVLSEGNFAFTHVLLGSWVLAQLVEITSQLVLYRRGV